MIHKELRTICQTSESSLHDGIYAKLVARRISLYITNLLIKTPITPNQITIFWCTLDILAGISFSFGVYKYFIIGTLLMQLAYILDGADGEVARYKNKASLKGEYLDRLCHDISYPALFIGLSIGLYERYNDIWILILGFSASIFFLQMLLLDLERFNILRTKNGSNNTNLLNRDDSARNSLLKRISKIIIDPFGIDAMLMIFLIASLLNLMELLLLFYGIGFPLRWLIQVYFNLNYRFT
jgi:phosphatidylglycerophosphate synthase